MEKNAILFNRVDLEDGWVSSGIAFKVGEIDTYEKTYNEIKAKVEAPEIIDFIIEDDCLLDDLFDGDTTYKFVKTYWGSGLVFVFENSEGYQVEHRYKADYIYIPE